MPTLEQAKEEILNYSKLYRNPNLPPYEISNPYNLFPLEIDPSVTNQWPASYPFGDHQGIYLILNDQMEVCYVGKASMNNILASRLSSYFGYGEGKRCRLYHDWKSKPHFIVTVAMHKNSGFEAASLEEYLIHKLKPIENTVGM